jgi:hypothetical protein
VTGTRWTRVATFAVVGPLASLTLAACGSSDFANDPRPPVPLETTGVITDSQVTVSPSSFGAGPILLTISNQTPESHTVTLKGGDISPERVGPINPGDSATIQKTVPEGSYEVAAESKEGVFSEIEPADITVGAPRGTASDDLLLP